MSRVTLFHGEKTKNYQQHDFPRHHTVTGTFHFSFITSYKKINENTKHTPIPLKLELKLKLEAIFCYTLIQTLFTN